jgi:2-polyprenyl-6-methoxyphenol hydroxylase-like FAD-dependent oxidoreductase
MSVGLVVDRDHVRDCGLAPEDLLKRTIAAAPWVAARMRDAERVTQVYARRDFSYRMKRIVGENYALIGDAAGFLDPIFSTGVFIAMKSADIASAAVEARLRRGSMRLLKRYQRDMTSALEKYFQFISNFYRREFLEVFLQPGEHFGLLPVSVGVLAGNVFAKKWDRLRLGLFFALVAIQKRKKVIAPPVVWDALPAAASSV